VIRKSNTRSTGLIVLLLLFLPTFSIVLAARPDTASANFGVNLINGPHRYPIAVDLVTSSADTSPPSSDSTPASSETGATTESNRDRGSVVEILGWLGWVVGLFSGWLQWRSYRGQKKNESGYLEVLERAARDRTGRYSEEELDRLQADIDQAKREMIEVVPAEAKRVFLQERSQSLVEQLYSTYEDYEKTMQDLGRSPETGLLSAQVRDAIEGQIRPRFLGEERRRRQTTALGITIAATILVALTLEFLVRYVERALNDYGLPFSAEDLTLWFLLMFLGGGAAVWAAISLPAQRRVGLLAVASALTSILSVAATIVVVDRGHATLGYLTSFGSIVAFTASVYFGVSSRSSELPRHDRRN
jgi:hypothetical protein